MVVNVLRLSYSRRILGLALKSNHLNQIIMKRQIKFEKGDLAALRLRGLAFARNDD